MRAAMPEYEVFVSSFPHATGSSSVRALFYLTFVFGHLLLLCCSFMTTVSVVIFNPNMNKVAIL